MNEVFYKFGVPETVHSDYEKQFTSKSKCAGRNPELLGQGSQRMGCAVEETPFTVFAHYMFLNGSSYKVDG